MLAITGRTAWRVLITAVVLHEVTAADDQLLTDAFLRWRAAHPAAATLAVTITAAHLLALLPRTIDPYPRAFTLLAYLKGHL